MHVYCIRPQNCTGRALLVACDTSNMAVRIAPYVWNYNLPRTEADYIERYVFT